MKTRYLGMFLFVLNMSSCVNESSGNKEYLTIQNLDSNIFVEIFIDNSGGTYGSTTTSYYYLTDSVSFRHFVFEVDDDEGLYYSYGKEGVFFNN